MCIKHSLWTFLAIISVSSTSNFKPRSVQEQPLILTPYLDANNIKEAQVLAQVKPDMNQVKSYSAFLTVNKACATHYFFWFVLSEKKWEEAPILLVTDGNSALNSMFKDFGPFKHLKKEGFVKNKFYWGGNNNLLFIDQPAGTGFSFSEKHCHADNLTQVAQETHVFLKQFFKLFPKLIKNQFFIVGQRFASKFALPIAYEIDQKNNKESEKINLKGIILGNPLLDARCEQIAEYAFQLGIFDEKQKDEREQFEKQMAKAINKKDYQGAFNLSENTDTNFELSSQYMGQTNILTDGQVKQDYTEYELYIRSYNVRKQIHVANIPYNGVSDPAYNFLNDDMMKPSTPELQHLLQVNKYILGFYFGQFDSAFSFATLPCVLREIKWSGYGDYYKTNRSDWYVGSWLAGWFKTSGNMFEAVVRNSGGNVLNDQPQAALDLITAAIASSPGSKLLKTLRTKPTNQ